MQTVILRFGQMSPADCYAAMAVRNAVFCVEQRITDVPDLDGVDPDCDHVLLRHGGRVVGTARLHEVTIDSGGAGPVTWIKVGRLAVLREHRGHGGGRAIMQAVHAYLAERGRPGRMHAQAYLEGWYTSLGWRREGEPFVEAGIAHVTMIYAG